MGPVAMLAETHLHAGTSRLTHVESMLGMGPLASREQKRAYPWFPLLQGKWLWSSYAFLSPTVMVGPLPVWEKASLEGLRLPYSSPGISSGSNRWVADL